MNDLFMVTELGSSGAEFKPKRDSHRAIKCKDQIRKEPVPSRARYEKFLNYEKVGCVKTLMEEE